MSDLGNKEIFAKNLNYYMNLNNVDRNKLCNDLDFNYTTVREWTNGTSYPRIDKIELLANYFGILKSDLIENKREINENNQLDNLLYSKAKELTDDEKRAVLQVMDAIHKDIDKELDK